jgi:hypothetical protein
MSGMDLIKQSIASMEAGDMDKLGPSLSDDFKFDGPVPEPIGKKEFLGLMKGLVTGIPDWKFNSRDYREDGNKVRLTVKIAGTQSRTLSLPMIPQPIAPTNKRVQLPEEHLEFSVAGNKITRIHSDTVPGGGVMGILEQLGVKVATH